MNKLEKRTIFLNTLFNLASALMSAFVSVYLYVYTDSLVIMTIYTIIRIGLFPISFILGSKISKKVPFPYTYALGLINADKLIKDGRIEKMIKEKSIIIDFICNFCSGDFRCDYHFDSIFIKSNIRFVIYGYGLCLSYAD